MKKYYYYSKRNLLNNNLSSADALSLQVNEFYYLFACLGSFLKYQDDCQGCKSFQEYAERYDHEDGIFWSCFNKASKTINQFIKKNKDRYSIQSVSRAEIFYLGRSPILSVPKIPRKAYEIEDVIFELISHDSQYQEWVQYYITYLNNKWNKNPQRVHYLQSLDRLKVYYIGYQQNVINLYPDKFDNFINHRGYSAMQTRLNDMEENNAR